MIPTILTAAFLFACALMVAFLCEESRKRWESTKRFTFLWVVVGESLIILGVAIHAGYQVAALVFQYAAIVGTPFILLAVIYHTREDEKDIKRRKLQKHGLEERPSKPD
jgi:small-conductance mechanosensitive channel